LEGEPLRILLVEDNAAHAKLVLKGFKDHKIGNRITHVSDGQEALDFLFHRGHYSDKTKSPAPHVVLLDLRLPKVDGLKVLKEIKTSPELQRIQVVILTTSEAEKNIAQAYDYHANAYLAKPVDFKEFMDQMNDLGFFWLCWNVH